MSFGFFQSFAPKKSLKMVENRCCLKREGVYRWFSGLSSAQRTEFLCGLLDLCVPVELRFLGSCLEDLARKDYHSLRDAEIKANNPADLALLANVTDEVVRSKLLVSLALLGSDNRPAAGALFRTLTHIDAIIHDYGLRLSDGRTGEQFLLLFTMAANHPAFSFHQKQVLRQQLAQIQELLQSNGNDTTHGGNPGSPAGSTSLPAYIGTPAHLTCCAKTTPREVMTGPVDDGLGSEVTSPTAAPSSQDLPVKMHAGKPGKVRVERIELKGVTHKADTSPEYTLEVMWSDSTLSIVSKTSQEVMELLSQVCVCVCHELDLRCLTSLSAHVLRHERVRIFCSASSSQPPSSTNLSCLLQYRGASRAVCGVASVQPVVNVLAPIIPQPSPAHLPPPSILPHHPSPAVGETTSSQQQTPQHQHQPHPSATPEQNGILDWLRKLRLHKYYPVFKQLTMEEFLALTEEDLNKYDLTQGAKKKLKTQLELQKEKLEKRYTMSQFPVSCGGVARVTPSSYNGPITHTHSSGTSNAELRVEVETGSLSSLRDSSSSSGYSSSPSSPMIPLKETLRRGDVECVDKERVCFLLSTAGSGPNRPTAQVLPVQNDPSVCASHPSVALPSIPLLAPGRGLGSVSRKPRPPLLCTTMGVEAPPTGHQEAEAACTTLTATSNALHHVSHPTLHFQVSATPGHARLTQYASPASSSSSSSFSSSSSSFSFSSSSKPAFSPISAVPMAAVSGNTYSANNASVVAPPTTSPVTTETACYGSGQSNGTTACVCSSCGCSGKCGSFYFPHPFSGTSLFTFGPLLHFSPLLAGGGSASPFSYPIVAPPLYNSTLSHESQQNLVLPPMQGFLGGGANIYQPFGMMGNGGMGQKKAGNISCYNCGLSGHRAHDCKQPPMDSAQQGMFRLKYSPQSDSQDSGD
ncbi:zinc finger CCHC domain-containing protein 14 [Clarias gariepinus]